MSTPNFHNVNASKLYAVQIIDEFDYDALAVSLQSALKRTFDFWTVDDAWDQNAPRSYGGKIIGGTDLYKSYKEMDVGIILQAVIRSGYYSGANLDWILSLDSGGEFSLYEGFDNLEKKLTEDFEDYGELSPKAAAHMAQLAARWVEENQEKLINQMEAVFTQYSTPLVCLGVASNGEALYREVT